MISHPCFGKMKRRFKPQIAAIPRINADLCKCRAPVKSNLDYIMKDYIDLSTIDYEYSMGEAYGAARAAFLEEVRRRSEKKKAKVIYFDDETKRKTSLEIEHENKIQMIKLMDTQEKSTCSGDYGCRCQSKMLTPLSMDDLLGPRIGCKILEFGRDSTTRQRFTIPKMTKVLTPAPRTGGIYPEKTKIFVEKLREKLKIIQKEIPDILQGKEEKEDAEKQKSELFRLKNLKNYNEVRLPSHPTSDDYTRKLLRRKIQVLGRCRSEWRENEAAEALAKKTMLEESKRTDEEKALAEKCKVIVSNKKFKRTIQNYKRNLSKMTSEENLRFFLKHYPNIRTLSERVAKFPPPDQTDTDKDLLPKQILDEDEEEDEEEDDDDDYEWSEPDPEEEI